MGAASTSFGLHRIGQILVTARDLERAVRFYRDTLGMTYLFQVPRMAFFDCGGIRLMLDIPEQAQFQHPPSILYYKVGDIAAVHRELQDKGVRFEDEPHVIAKLPTHDLWMTFARDSEDNIFALMSEVTQR